MDGFVWLAFDLTFVPGVVQIVISRLLVLLLQFNLSLALFVALHGHIWPNGEPVGLSLFVDGLHLRTTIRGLAHVGEGLLRRVLAAG